MLGSSISPGAVVEVIGGLALPAGAGKEGVFMVKALVVVGKIPMPRPGSQKAAQGCPGEGQLWGKGVQWEGQVPVRWWCMLCPVSRKAAVQSLFKEASGPSKTDWGRGAMRIPWMWASHPALGVESISAKQDALIKAILTSQVEYTFPKQLRFQPTIEDLNTCYYPSQSVNDEIINAYLHLLSAKQKTGNKIYMSIYTP